MPVIMILAYGLMNLMGIEIPDPTLPFWIAPGLFLIQFIFALGEEVGWMGYAIDPMQDRWTALKASIILGIVWAIWQIVPFASAHHHSIFIVGLCINLAVTRILIVWLYNNTGKSVFAVISYHAMYTISTFMFPNYDSIYGPFISCIVITIIAFIVTFLWGPKTLAQFRKN